MKHLISGSILFTLGSILSWYGSNLQFVSNWWKERPFLSILLFSIPISSLYYFGTRYVYMGSGSLWSVRFLSYSLSYLVFPFMTLYYLGESMFTTKTMTCIFLSFVMLYIQIFWE